MELSVRVGVAAPVLAVGISGDGRRVVMGGQDGRILSWSVPEDDRERIDLGVTMDVSTLAPLRLLALQVDGAGFAVGRDGHGWVLHLRSGRVIESHAVGEVPAGASAVTVAAGGAVLLGTDDGRVYRLGGVSAWLEVADARRPVRSLACHGFLVVAVCGDDVNADVEVLVLRDGCFRHAPVPAEPSASPRCLAVSEDRTLVVGRADGRVGSYPVDMCTPSTPVTR